jgi:hypothetical protein
MKQVLNKARAVFIFDKYPILKRCISFNRKFSSTQKAKFKDPDKERSTYDGAIEINAKVSVIQLIRERRQSVGCEGIRPCGRRDTFVGLDPSRRCFLVSGIAFDHRQPDKCPHDRYKMGKDPVF